MRSPLPAVLTRPRNLSVAPAPWRAERERHDAVVALVDAPLGQMTGRDAGGRLDPDAITDAYWTLVEQDRSAWTPEPAAPR